MRHSERTITRRQLLIAIGGTAVAAGSAGLYELFRLWRRPGGTAYHGPSVSLADVAESDIFDVCIIGSGPAGVIPAIQLARRGLRTILLESGASFPTMFEEPRYNELNSYESSGDALYPLAATRIRALGGTTNIWTGRCNRLHGIDFERNAYTPAGSGWPIRYSDIHRYYTGAEKTLRVSWPGRYEYPAGHHFPFLREVGDPRLRRLRQFRKFMAEKGLSVDTSPTSSGIRHRGPVRIAGDYLASFSDQRAGLLVTGATAVRLSRGSSGEIGVVEVRDLDGHAKSIAARVFIVACGAVETARLLLLSQSERNPRGMGNRFDQVGRFFHEHPTINFNGRLPATTTMPIHSPGRSDQFYDSFKREGYGSILLGFRNGRRDDGTVYLRIGATIEMLPVASNRIILSETALDLFGNPGARVNLSFSPEDQRTMARIRSLIQSIYARLDAEDVTELPIHWSHHHLGGVCMGADPRHSVVDRNLRVHDAPNLFLSTSGCFVTGGAAHPTLLIVALAHRLADHLIAAFSAGRFKRASADRPANAA
ncbi:MAG: GMC oxidoreductase [Gammaproteobacteria bacterium]